MFRAANLRSFSEIRLSGFGSETKKKMGKLCINVVLMYLYKKERPGHVAMRCVLRYGN